MIDIGDAAAGAAVGTGVGLILGNLFRIVGQVLTRSVKIRNPEIERILGRLDVMEEIVTAQGQAADALTDSYLITVDSNVRLIEAIRRRIKNGDDLVEIERMAEAAKNHLINYFKTHSRPALPEGKKNENNG